MSNETEKKLFDEMRRPVQRETIENLSGVLAEIYEYAIKGKRITYGAFIRQSWPCDNMRELFEDLNQSMVEDFEHSRPFLAALIISGKTGIPGAGFYKKAAELGRFKGAIEGIDARSFAELEANKAIEYWCSNPITQK